MKAKTFFLRIFYVIVGIAVGGALMTFFFFKPADDDKDYQKIINKNYAIYAPPLPKKISFANETVPLDNFDVRESFDRELLRFVFGHSQMIMILKKVKKYFSVMEPILKKHNVPDDLKYLAVCESYLANVISPAKAVGVWQFLKDTGKEYGLEINEEVDERYHLEKSTEAACKYLNALYDKYKSWSLVAAAYNMGHGALDKQIKIQENTNYYDLLLNEETSRYVYTIVAIKYVIENQQTVGFHYRQKDIYPTIKLKEVVVDSSITNLTNFAKKFNLSYKMLKYFNPWLRENRLTNHSKKKYYISIPVEGYRNYDYSKDITETDTIFKLIDNPQKVLINK